VIGSDEDLVSATTGVAGALLTAGWAGFSLGDDSGSGSKRIRISPESGVQLSADASFRFLRPFLSNS